METQVKFLLRLPLKEMASRRVAVFFWNDSDILNSISKFRSDGFSTEESKREWRENIEDKIKDKILKLELPKPLTKQMFVVIRSMSLDIKRWKYFHLDFLHEGLFVSPEGITLPGSAKLCWTMEGRIDHRETAKELIRRGGLTIRDRYELACLYCLEEWIPLLWEKLPDEQKEYFCVDDELLPDLHCCWPHIFKGELSRLDHLLRRRNLTSFNQWAFEESVERGYKTAAEYFYQRLRREEREISLMRSAHRVLSDPDAPDDLAERLSDVLCYLLSLMTHEQRIEAVVAHPTTVLLCFLHWPWQDLFMENAALIWNSLPMSGYDHLLHKMSDIFKKYCPTSFPELFIQSPLSFKRYFVGSDRGFIPACRFLSIFFRFEDSNSIEAIFRHVDASDRVELLFHPDVLDLFYKSILRERWCMVEVCLREAVLSRADRKRLKEVFTGFLERRGNRECVNRKFEGLFEVLDETDECADKNKLIV